MAVPGQTFLDQWPTDTEIDHFQDGIGKTFGNEFSRVHPFYRPGLDCHWCGRVIRTQAFMGTDHCSDNHRKLLHPEKPVEMIKVERRKMERLAEAVGRLRWYQNNPIKGSKSGATKVKNGIADLVEDIVDEIGDLLP